MKPEERTAPFCTKCERPLRHRTDGKPGPPADTVTVNGPILIHDGCGGDVIASWRSIQPS